MLSRSGLTGSFTLLRPSRSASRGGPSQPLVRDCAVNLNDPFDIGLAGLGCRLERDGTTPTRLNTRRWRADATASDRWLLDRCHGPTVDLGCGPGRLVAALAARGVPALGVDNSRRAVAQCCERGARVLHGDVFDTLPNEGHWRHVLLADGNLGIGGDPVVLLSRVRKLINTDGSVLVELHAHEAGLWQGRARIAGPDGSCGRSFPWATVGAEAISEVAAAAGLALRQLRRRRHRRRAFAELHAA